MLDAVIRLSLRYRSLVVVSCLILLVYVTTRLFSVEQ